MAELEIKHEGEETHDPYGQRVGLAAALIAVVLAIVTIASHRSHTSAVVLRSEANDQWSHYQSKRLKSHTAELGRDLLLELRPDGNPDLRKRYADEVEKNNRESEEVSAEARKLEAQVSVDERKALRYDLGEGLLEVGLVLCSIYFISRKRIFPPVGILAALTGAAIALTGIFL